MNISISRHVFMNKRMLSRLLKRKLPIFGGHFIFFGLTK